MEQGPTGATRWTRHVPTEFWWRGGGGGKLLDFWVPGPPSPSPSGELCFGSACPIQGPSLCPVHAPACPYAPAGTPHGLVSTRPVQAAAEVLEAAKQKRRTDRKERRRAEQEKDPKRATETRPAAEARGARDGEGGGGDAPAGAEPHISLEDVEAKFPDATPELRKKVPPRGRVEGGGVAGGGATRDGAGGWGGGGGGRGGPCGAHRGRLRGPGEAPAVWAHGR